MSHECAAGRACRGATVENHCRTPALVADERALCRACQRAVRVAVRELTKDYVALADAMGERPVTGQLAVKHTPDPVIPLNVSVLALRDELAEWAEAAVVLVASSCNVVPRLRQKLRGYPMDNWGVVDQCHRLLDGNIGRLLDAPDGDVRIYKPEAKVGQTCWSTASLDGITVALKMQRVHARVKGFLGEHNPRVRLAMPCPVLDCGMPTLGIGDGETDVTCTSCGGRWSETEYEWLAHQITYDRQESTMLRWLLAEANWKLERVQRIAALAEDDVNGFDAYSVVVLLREALGEKEKVAS